MNTKVEEALALLDAEVAGCGRLEPEDCDNCARIKKARTTIAAHIAKQDATIARMFTREQVAALMRSVVASGSIYYGRGVVHEWDACRTETIARIEAWLNQGEGK